MRIKKILRKLCLNRQLPTAIRRKIIRSTLPEFQLDLQGIVFRQAVSFDDYIKAFRLLHDVYVASGYIDPSPSALRIVPQHSHPDSRVFLGCRLTSNGQRTPIYTISLFADSDQGLPMDMAFKNELDVLRNQGRTLAEAGCLAANPVYRKGDMNIPMIGNRIVILYAKQCMGVDDLVISVHPKFQWVYEDVLLFEKIKTIDSYSYVKGNPAVAMRLDLKKLADTYKSHYGQMPSKKNLYWYFFCDRCPSVAMLDYVQNSCLPRHIFNYEDFSMNCRIQQKPEMPGKRNQFRRNGFSDIKKVG